MIICMSLYSFSDLVLLTFITLLKVEIEGCVHMVITNKNNNKHFLINIQIKNKQMVYFILLLMIMFLNLFVYMTTVYLLIQLTK